jgi:hypothetical protein
MRRALAIIGPLALVGAAGCADSCQAADVARPPASTSPSPGTVAQGATEPAPPARPGSGRVGTTPGIANDQLLEDPNVVTEPNADRVGTTPGIANDQLLAEPNVITDQTDRLGTTPGIRSDQRIGGDPNIAGDRRLRDPQGVNPLELQTIVPGTIAGPYVGYQLVPVPVPPAQAEAEEPERANYYIVESGGREWAVPEEAVEQGNLYLDEGE